MKRMMNASVDCIGISCNICADLMRWLDAEIVQLKKQIAASDTFSRDENKTI